MYYYVLKTKKRINSGNIQRESSDYMKAIVKLDVNGSKEAIWKVVADIENSDKNISAIIKIEVSDKPNNNILGFKWRETRTMFGKEATEVMWITEYKENVYYKTRAESHGAIYLTTISIEEKNNCCALSMCFEGISVSFFAKISSALLGRMMMKSTEKALRDDLNDIKMIVEK